ncbi:MAG: bifunctional histidinol-phosphatase/imidazoleglycerol-phosphate dehydratase HisB [Ignavibacteriae bacterium]|nr:bifunctional histidinol-phosphatase/imidazoleglycerol-phosphate dehydratase HisB [Ignavibacteria bacterium]MBI3365647.1 bifunctional histidinol-phosphatase/imidazoleglycerol-phosphate dehydratase HisB [Ignavibacteriota bacterium]
MKKVVFVDRDGTIIREPAGKQIDSLEKLEFIPGIIRGLKLLVDSGFTLVMVSNQDGLGTKQYPQKAFALVQKKILSLLEGEEITFEKIVICPHLRTENCRCRKPKTGLVESYMKKHAIDRGHSFVLGDRLTDVEFANNLGVHAIRLTRRNDPRAKYVTPDVFDACSFIARFARMASFTRTTSETTIAVNVTLDGAGKYEIATGIGFFDHMLEQLARHSRMDVTIHARGDLHIDEHHTVEDTGIVLGKTIREALGRKKGIQRFAFAAPLDEALAEVSIDLSGRSYVSFDCKFIRERVGEMPTELVEDFFRGFADGLGATMHIRCSGRNDHHKIEAIFKSVAVALRSAVHIDSRTRSFLPSTKGLL